MTVVLLAVGALLALWGFYVLSTLDAIAALDVGSHLVIGGVLVIALGGIIQSLNRLRREIASHAPRAEPAASFDDDDLAEVPELASSPAVAPPAPVAASPVVEPPAPVASVPRPVIPVRAPAVLADEAAPPLRRDTSERPVPDFLVRTAAAAPVAATPMVAAESAAPMAEDNTGEAVLLREGSLNGVNYRFYSDGAVEAEWPSGSERYPSLEALRAVILERRSQPMHAESVAADEDVEATSSIDRDVEPAGNASARERAWDLSAAPAPRIDADHDLDYIEPAIHDLLPHADTPEVSIDPAEHSHAPSLDAPVQDPLVEDGIFYGRDVEGEAGDDEIAGEHGEDRRERWSETLRMLLRRDRTGAAGADDKAAEKTEGDDLFDFRKGPG